MDQIIFKVQGSAPEPYVVTFKKDGINLNAYCTCPAGEIGQYCKHRLNILEGFEEGIVSGNTDEVKKIVAWLPGTNVADAWAELHFAEDRLELAKKDVASMKKKLARALLK